MGRGALGASDLGDNRLNRRAVRLAAGMAAAPEQSLPAQCPHQRAWVATDGRLNDARLSLAQLAGPAWAPVRPRATGGRTLLVSDTTEADFSHHPTMTGLGPSGDGRGRGRLLHSVGAGVPGAVPAGLGVVRTASGARRADAARPIP